MAPQRMRKVWLIGFLGPAPRPLPRTALRRSRTGLRELGYVVGKNVVIEFRWAEGAAPMRELAAELVRLNVDLSSQLSTEVEAARQATRNIPIVFATHADPVGIGHVASLARPGGNATGFSVGADPPHCQSFGGLRDAVPRAARFGVLFSSDGLLGSSLQAAQSAAERPRVTLEPVAVRAVDDFQALFAPRAGSSGRSFSLRHRL